MSDEDIQKFVTQIIKRLDERWQKSLGELEQRLQQSLSANNATLREMAIELSRHMDDFQNEIIFILDRLEKINISTSDNRATSRLVDRKLESLKVELEEHHEKLRELEQEAKNHKSVPWWIYNQILMEKEKIANLQKELGLK